MLRWLNIVAILAAVAVGIAVVQVKSAVKAQREAVEKIAETIRRDREAIRVLKAEWALLSSPELLQDRAYRFLALMPMQADQIVSSPDAIPMRRRGEDAADDAGVLKASAEPKKNAKARQSEEEKGV